MLPIIGEGSRTDASGAAGGQPVVQQPMVRTPPILPSSTSALDVLPRRTAPVRLVGSSLTARDRSAAVPSGVRPPATGAAPEDQIEVIGPIETAGESHELVAIAKGPQGRPAVVGAVRTSERRAERTAQLLAQAALANPLNPWHAVGAVGQNALVFMASTSNTFGFALGVGLETMTTVMKENLPDWLANPETTGAAFAGALATYAPAITLGALTGAVGSILAQIIAQPLTRKFFATVCTDLALTPAPLNHVVPDADPDHADVAAHLQVDRARERVKARQSPPLLWKGITGGAGALSFSGAEGGRAAAITDRTLTVPKRVGLDAASSAVGGLVTGGAVGAWQAWGMKETSQGAGDELLRVRLYNVVQGPRPGWGDDVALGLHGQKALEKHVIAMFKDYATGVGAAAKDFAGGRQGMALGGHVFEQWVRRALGIFLACAPLFVLLPAAAAATHNLPGPENHRERQAINGAALAIEFAIAVFVWFPWLLNHAVAKQKLALPPEPPSERQPVAIGNTQPAEVSLEMPQLPTAPTAPTAARRARESALSPLEGKYPLLSPRPSETTWPKSAVPDPGEIQEYYKARGGSLDDKTAQFVHDSLQYFQESGWTDEAYEAWSAKPEFSWQKPQEMGEIEEKPFTVSDGQKISLRLYPMHERPKGTILFFHGGGFALGSPNSHDGILKRLADETGMDVLAVAYRRAGKEPGPAGHRDGWDVARAVLQGTLPFARQPSENLFLMGDSAGGSIAVSTSHYLKDQNIAGVKGVATIYPTLTGPDPSSPEREIYADDGNLASADVKGAWDRYVPNATPEMMRSLCPAASARPEDFSGLPPTLTIGVQDPLLGDAREYSHKIKNAGGEAYFYSLPGVHNAFRLQDSPVTNAMHELIRTFVHATASDNQEITAP
jgi:acetyl esterase